VQEGVQLHVLATVVLVAASGLRKMRGFNPGRHSASPTSSRHLRKSLQTNPLFLIQRFMNLYVALLCKIKLRKVSLGLLETN
jgi:hypothetical protein